MPLPLAHTVVGYSVAAATGVRFRRDTRTALLFSVVVANLPDIDYLPGVLNDTPVLYHRTAMHTLFAAALCALVVAAIVTRFRGRFSEILLLAFLVYTSHLVADMIDWGGGNGGVPILWPASTAYYTIVTPWTHTSGGALDFKRGADTTRWVHSFAALGFLRALVLQALVFAPLLLPAWWIRSRRNSVEAVSPSP